MTTYHFLQLYWWALVSLLGALLVFLMFVQGGQTLLYGTAKNENQRNILLTIFGHKWEITYTTLITFGGAAFASFPLFYSTSFGGAYWLWILILLVFQISCGVVSEEYTVKYISDGDTITVTNNKTNKKVKVRLFGIDAPEKTQEYGLESKEYLMSLIKDKVIIIKGKTYDKYGRLLGTIYIDGMNVNEMMVQTGNAWWYESFDSKNSKVRDLQIKAKEGKLGLWKNPNAIEPEEYRRKEREKYKK